MEILTPPGGVFSLDSDLASGFFRGPARSGAGMGYHPGVLLSPFS